MSQPELRLIPLSSIRPSPYQYRTNFDDSKQKDLIESMRAIGLSTPILVRRIVTPSPAGAGPAGSEILYELVSGERRWRAAKALGWETIQAVCEEMTDAEAAARVVTENEVRGDTNIMEKAAAYKRLTQPPCGMNCEEIAKRYGWKDGTSVRRIIELLDQPETIREFLSRDRIKESHIRFLNRIKDLKWRIRLAKQAAEEEWSSRMTEERVAKLLGEGAKKGKGPGKKRAKAAPEYEYDYCDFHLALVGEQVVLSGRNFQLNEVPRQFARDIQTALESFVRDILDKSIRQPPPIPQDAGAAAPTTEAPPAPSAVANPQAAPDLAKQFAEAAKPITDFISGMGKTDGGASGLTDLLSIFTKPKPPG